MGERAEHQRGERRLKKHMTLFGLGLDGLAVFAALVAAAWIKFNSGLFPVVMPMSLHVVLAGAAISIPFWWVMFGASGAYRLHWDRSWGDELRMVIKPVTTGFIILFFGAFLISPSASVGRWIIIFYYALLINFVFIARGISRVTERRMARKGLLVRNAAIVGVGEAALSLERYLVTNRALGYRVVGFVEPPRPTGETVVDQEHVLGGVSELAAILSEHPVQELLVTIASNFHDDILSLMLPSAAAGVRIKVVPDIFDVVAGHVHNTQIMGQPLMELLPERLSFLQKLVKTSMDYLISMTALVVGLPAWILVALAVKLDSRGPVFYRQERVGRGGKLFRVFKFRSMVHDAERHSGPVWAGRNDSRVTKTGRFLRRSRLDEIPQFLNVLAGDMSIVGPRPERPAFVEDLRRIYPFYPKRLTLKPGITGWAQVKLEYDTDVESVADKLKYDFYYIENQSIFLDLEILARTLKVVLTGAGAH